MRSLLAVICLLSACAAPAPASSDYVSPAKTPYDANPRLRAQYLKAYQAGWNFSVESISEEKLREALESESGSLMSTFATCCEATWNVTRGWYDGLHAGDDFVAQLTKTQAPPERVLARFLRLKADLIEYPVKNWYVADTCKPDDLVAVEEEGGARIRVWRDSTKTLLHEVRGVKDGKTHGRCETYDANGMLHQVSTWVDGVREGECMTYSDTGGVMERSTYRKDKEHGASRSYADSGGLVCLVQYVEGDRQGRKVMWAADGTPKSLEHFKDNLLHGRQVLFVESGALISVYDNGKQRGDQTGPVPVDRLPEDEQPAVLNRLR